MARRGIKHLPRDLAALNNAINDEFAEKVSNTAVGILADYIHNTPVKTGFMQSQWQLDSDISGDVVHLTFSNDTFYFAKVYFGSKLNAYFPDIVTDSICPRFRDSIVDIHPEYPSGSRVSEDSQAWKRWFNFASALGPVVGGISIPSVEARRSPQELLNF